MGILDSLSVPVIVAPMAGGPSTPELVTAAGQVGSLGFLAGGTSSVAQFRTQLAQVSGRFGVNLFRPQEEKPTPSDVDEVAGLLTQAFREYRLGEPVVPAVDLTNGWAEKFHLAVAARPAVISSTFGMFTPDEFATLKQAGIEAWVTVTNENDARTAERAGADVLVVQGPEAGGHRSTWSLTEEPDRRSLDELLRAVVGQVRIPVVAAGGVSTREGVQRMLDLGASAVACGSVFLLADEAGTSATNRELLLTAGERGVTTTCSRAFSGRYARGVKTRFVRENESLPPVYPYLNVMIAPLRAAAGATGNWDYAYCLVGTGIGNIKTGSVKQILSTMNPSV
ncbi:oxidoreductase, 2-nitropropane dioxygenase family protein [Corynebacterium efficiens YS-314]|nr:nitronate monooxygenase [Corynebacterium efficiens]EEW49862.1 oxidoreductase, 2-nitropropane dioxygenase family protein [Corynebacterium efficiens YS-314]